MRIVTKDRVYENIVKIEITPICEHPSHIRAFIDSDHSEFILLTDIFIIREK